MREIVLDTETTGLDPGMGDRIVEIGCVELINHMPTGNELHLYINPERDMPDEAFRVHGLSEEFLSGYPVFAELADQFIDFIADDKLIIHNASFDMKFINAELRWLERPTLPMDRAIDTLLIARKKYPGSPVSLDALCRRFGIDNTQRTKHGALLDSLLLAEVYLELVGGREPGLALGASGRGSSASDTDAVKVVVERPYRAPRPYSVPAEDLAAHEAFLAKIKNPLWTRGPQ